MTDTIAVAGYVATDIKHTVTAEGLEIASFRLASSNRRYDKATGAWVDGETNWFTVTAFRQLAGSIHASIERGHRVVLTGRLHVRDWKSGEKSGTNVEIIADALGPDLAWGRASYSRTPKQGGSDAARDTGAPMSTADDAAGFPAEAQEALPVPF